MWIGYKRLRTKFHRPTKAQKGARPMPNAFDELIEQLDEFLDNFEAFISKYDPYESEDTSGGQSDDQTGSDRGDDGEWDPHSEE